MSATRVFHLDTGGCGACAVEVWAAVESSRELEWAVGPQQADVVALTGSITPATREAVLTLYRTYFAGRVPVVAIGRCAIDGHPYGKGGLAVATELVTHGRVEACPPVPLVILDTLLAAASSSVEEKNR